MLKENWRLITRIERVADCSIIIAAFFLSYYGRNSLFYWNEIFSLKIPFEGSSLAPLKDYFIVLFTGLVAYLISLNLLGAYQSMRLSSSWSIFRVATFSAVVVFFILTSTLFLLKINLSRAFIILFCVISALSLTIERFFVIRFLRYWRKQGWNYRNVIISGLGRQASRLAQEIYKHPELGIRIRAFADLKGITSNNELQDFKLKLKDAGYSKPAKILKGTAQVEKALKEYAIDEVLFTDVIEVMPEVEETVLACTEFGVRTTIAADLFSIGLIKSGLSYFGDMPLIHFQTPPGDRWELNIKRVIDVLISGFLLVLLTPVFLLVALAVKISTDGKILFTQRRVGLNGRLFNLYKFRSMYKDAERQLAHLREQNEMDGPVFKMKNDPRVTPLGKFLRKFSLDELPQLWNVFAGDMSLVGPRPPVPGEVSLYERKDRRRLSMRPGLTCIWQVSGRNKIPSFDEWVKLDLEYIDNWSMGRDFLLLMKTIPVVLFGRGAS